MKYSLSQLDSTLCFEALAALVVHLWLQRSEPQASLSFSLILLAISSLPVFFFSPSLGLNIWQPYLVFFAVLSLSVVSYRLSPLHPLARYPGPVMCKTSKLWMVYISLQGKQHEYFQELHRKYGPVVRVGPNELSITEKDFIQAIMSKDGLPKGPMWKGRIVTAASQKNKSYSLIGTQDLLHHAKLRKPWNKAFGPTPMTDYTDLVVAKAFELSEHLMTLCRSPCEESKHVNLAEWLSYFSFDFMGEMAFGCDFALMRDGDKNGLWNKMESALLLPSITQHIPWAARVLQRLFLVDKENNFSAFAVGQAKLRATQEVKKKDLFYHLLQSVDPESVADSFPMIVSNAVLAIIAGSDTTATALSNIMYYLLTNSRYLDALRAEIEASFPLKEHSPIQGDKLAGLKMLNAVINESLRLLPPLPIMLQRAAPKGSGGKLVGNCFIPEGTAVVVPPYCLHRDPRYFSPRTEEFWPDRWFTDKADDPTLVHDPTAFIPFSVGPTNCAGKSLAVFELRYITAMLVRTFDISFQPHFAPRLWEERLLDRFVFTKGRLPVVLSPRTV